MRKSYFLLLFAIMLLNFSGCTPLNPTDPISEIRPAFEATTTTRAIEISTPLPSVTPTQPLTTVEGPLLLLQTDFFEYRYLNPITQISYPFQLLITDPQFRLSANQSPSGRLMFFPQDENTGNIIDLRTGEVVHTYDFSSPVLFNPQQAVNAALPLVTELDLNEASLLEAISQAHQTSRQLLHWYQSDRYHLSVADTSQVSTSLFLDDHQTGIRLQLEDQPGLVQDYRIGPDGNQILLKKGWVFRPGAYRDKHYYLINVKDQTTQQLLLPEDIQNPSVTWFSENTLGVVHQAYMSGGSGFSLIDIDTMQTTQIITGEFLNLRHLGEGLLVIRQEADSETTTFEIMSPEGELLAAQTIEKSCYFQYSLSNRIIIQCELESYLLDQDLNIESYFDDILTLTPAPDGSAFVMMNRTEQCFLLGSNLQIQYKLTLDDIPLEIQWLPDSSGFLYRTHGRLYYYDLGNQTGHLLVESDLFSDYTNINAVWVNLD